MSTAVLLEVIQGKKHWRELPTHGVDVRFYAGEWKFPPLVGEPLQPSARDLVQGIRALLHEPAALVEWAQFILAASDFVELEGLGDRGEQIRECLWDLSRGQAASHEAAHATCAVPQYDYDSNPYSPFFVPAETGSVMEQGVPPEILGAELREFSEEDAELLRGNLNIMDIDPEEEP